jgi:hypothetical protein
VSGAEAATAPDTPVLRCTPACSASPRTTVSATSAAVTVKGAAEQIDDLGDAVVGVGPGKSLNKKIGEANAALGRNDLNGACGILRAFMREVQAQAGKSISPSTATSLIANATRINTLLDC